MLPNLTQQVYKDLQNEEILNFLKEIWLSNFYNSGFEFIPEKIFKRIPEAKNFNEILSIIEEEFGNREFKKFNRKKRKEGNLNAFGYKIIEESLKKSKSYLDFGCGRMALIRRICREDLPDLEKIYGYDPKAQMEYIAFDQKDRVSFLDKIREVKELENIDLITINYVLHHLTNEELNEALETCRKILSKDGEIIILEESFYEEQITSLPSYFLTFQNISNQELNQKFQKLNKETKLKILFLNDVLLNYKNLDYMPWTMNYKSIDEWRTTFQEKGFEVKEVQDFGFLKGQKQKGGTVSMMVLK